MKNRGVILVLFLLAAGMAATGGAIWYQHRQSRQMLRFWGPDVAQLIDSAPKVELFALSSGNVPAVEENNPASSAAIDISDARGLIHFRRSLLEDGSFDAVNVEQSVPSEADWDYAVRFSNADSSVLVVFNLDDRRLVKKTAGNLADDRGVALISERVAQGLATFFEDQTQTSGPRP